jgi:hypothetical protein
VQRRETEPDSLVERDPVLDTITEGVKAHFAVVHEIPSDLVLVEPAFVPVHQSRVSLGKGD